MVTRLFYFHTSNMSQRYCPNCNFTTTDASTTYCPRCGKPLVEQDTQSGNTETYCPFCNHPNPANATFCSNCGKPLKPSSGKTGVNCPPNYLVWAILATVFCCLPFGIISIVYADKVERLWHMGEYEEAQEASDKARMWAIVAASAAAAIIAVYIIFVLITVSSFVTAASPHF